MTEGAKYLEKAWMSVGLPTASKVAQLQSDKLRRERAWALLV
jgi:hypothetical protein